MRCVKLIAHNTYVLLYSATRLAPNQPHLSVRVVARRLSIIDANVMRHFACETHQRTVRPDTRMYERASNKHTHSQKTRVIIWHTNVRRRRQRHNNGIQIKASAHNNRDRTCVAVQGNCKCASDPRVISTHTTCGAWVFLLNACASLHECTHVHAHTQTNVCQGSGVPTLSHASACAQVPLPCALGLVVYATRETRHSTTHSAARYSTVCLQFAFSLNKLKGVAGAQVGAKWQTARMPPCVYVCDWTDTLRLEWRAIRRRGVVSTRWMTMHLAAKVCSAMCKRCVSLPITMRLIIVIALYTTNTIVRPRARVFVCTLLPCASAPVCELSRRRR